MFTRHVARITHMNKKINEAHFPVKKNLGLDFMLGHPCIGMLCAKCIHLWVSIIIKLENAM